MNEKTAQRHVKRFQYEQARKRSLFLVVRDEPYACFVITATADRTVAAALIHGDMTEGEVAHCPVWQWAREPDGSRPYIPKYRAEDFPRYPDGRDEDGHPIECPYRIQEVKDGASIMIGHAE